MFIFFYQFKKWLKGLLFKNRKKPEPEPPITFTGLIRQIDQASPKLEVQIQENKEFNNSSAIEGLFGTDVIAQQDAQAEIREMSYFATKNNIQETFWDGPRVYGAGEIIDEESGLRAIASDLDNAVFGDDVEMVSNRVPKAIFSQTTAHYSDYNKPKEEIEDFDPKVFVFKQPYEIDRKGLITYLKGHTVPFESRTDFLKFGKMLMTTGGWHKWEWFPAMFDNASDDTLYEVYLLLRTAEHKQQTEIFYQLKQEQNGNDNSHGQSDSTIQTGDTLSNPGSSQGEVSEADAGKGV